MQPADDTTFREAVHAVIWDMDGVLVDTGEFHFQSWQETLPAYQISFTRETFRETFGMNNAEILQQLLGERFSTDLAAEISDLKEERFRAGIAGQIALLSGVHTLLERLRQRRIKQAVGSSAPYANIEAIVTALNLESYFEALVSAADMPGKPNPMVFLTAAHHLGVSPAHCVVIEDAIAGVVAARRAGMRCIAVTTTNAPDDLQDADLVVKQLDEIEVARFLAL